MSLPILDPAEGIHAYSNKVNQFFPKYSDRRYYSQKRKKGEYYTKPYDTSLPVISKANRSFQSLNASVDTTPRPVKYADIDVPNFINSKRSLIDDKKT